MAVFRVERTENYTVMSNVHLDDHRLSLKARGLLSLMLRLPDDWDYTLDGLCKLCPEGKAAIRSAVEELEGAGYVVREQSHAENGRFASNDYTIYEQPQHPPGSPSCENRTTVPSCDFPTTGNCTTVSYKKEPSTNTPHKPPTGGKRAPAEAWEPELFERLWKFYPRCKNESKQNARRAWDKLKPDNATIHAIGRHLAALKATEMWQRGIGIPYLTTYLNQRRWEGADFPSADTPAAAPQRVADLEGVEVW